MSLYRLGYDLGNPGFETGKGKKFLSIPQCLSPSFGPFNFPLSTYRALFLAINSWCAMLATQLHLSQWFRMSGPIILLPLYA